MQDLLLFEKKKILNFFKKIVKHFTYFYLSTAKFFLNFFLSTLELL